MEGAAQPRRGAACSGANWASIDEEDSSRPAEPAANIDVVTGSPAHGSQPGAQAGRHALEGLDLDLQVYLRLRRSQIVPTFLRTVQSIESAKPVAPALLLQI